MRRRTVRSPKQRSRSWFHTSVASHIKRTNRKLQMVRASHKLKSRMQPIAWNRNLCVKPLTNRKLHHKYPLYPITSLSRLRVALRHAYSEPHCSRTIHNHARRLTKALSRSSQYISRVVLCNLSSRILSQEPQAYESDTPYHITTHSSRKSVFLVGAFALLPTYGFQHNGLPTQHN